MKNTLYCGDNLDVLRKYVEDESIDLIYIDPPFFSNKHYEVVWGDEAEVRSFEDRWEGGINVYIEWMRPRVEELYRVLKPTGSFYLHCDWHANAHLKIMAEEIFDHKNFRNEIVWHYGQRTMHNPKKWNAKHDTILFYAKSSKTRLNVLTVPWTREDITKTRARKIHKDDKGEYIWDNRSVSRGFPPKKQYIEDIIKKGKAIDDVWDIPMILSTSKERLGYPTQKPEALLERIIRASSHEGGLILDAFCGCGTTLVVAQKLERNWIGIDISPTATNLMERRLANIEAVKDEDYVSIGMPTTVNDLRQLKPFEFQNWVINEMGARHSRKKVDDKGIDGYFVKDLWHEAAGIQVKQSNSVGRPTIDNFKAALERKKYKKGFVIAFSFTKGSHEESARIKHDDGFDIKLVEVEALLLKKKPI